MARSVETTDHDRRTGSERRGPDTGPPQGIERRQGLRRQASEVLKPPCPWCGSSTSAVYRSRPNAQALAQEKYIRRRQCADCGQDWPTEEKLDLDAFVQELKQRGIDAATLGLQRGDTRAPTEAEAEAKGQPLVSWSEWFWRRRE